MLEPDIESHGLFDLGMKVMSSALVPMHQGDTDQRQSCYNVRPGVGRLFVPVPLSQKVARPSM